MRLTKQASSMPWTAPWIRTLNDTVHMRSEVGQGDELILRSAALQLQVKIQVLKYNSTTAAIMVHTYPGATAAPVANGGRTRQEWRGRHETI